MRAEDVGYFSAKISVEDFKKVIAKLYGPLENVRLEWIEYYVRTGADDFQVQLSAVYKRSISSTGVAYEVDLWDHQSYEDGVKTNALLEAEFQIAVEMEPVAKQTLPLTFVSVIEKDLGENGMPNDGTHIWLDYGAAM